VISEAMRKRFRQAEGWVQKYARHYGVPAEVVAALIDVESHWNPQAVLSSGAMGLMQLMPATPN
jgi:soluble lytic murein transglycosylase-like protein